MTPLVLIPGMMCDARMWGDLPRHLAPRPVIHALPVGAETIAGIAARILRDLPARFALAGLSMGGIVAMQIVAQASARVDRLALLDTNPLAEAPDAQARRGPQMARALGGDLAGVMREEMKPNYLAAGPGQGAVLDLCMDMVLALGPQVFAQQSRALRDRPDQQAALAGYKRPALVAMGAEDRLCPRDRHELMHALMPQSRLLVIDGAGHLPPLEQPARIRAALMDWLEEPA
jgi:pimeloyl-ACP methyl ester carboxylesterase